MLETIIRGASVLDGLGSAPRVCDVGLSGGRIAAIGALDGLLAEREVSAQGLALIPGIIDVHTHYDLCIDWAGLPAHTLRQGVTTVIGGNCGMGPGDIRAHLDEVEARGIGIRYGVLASHGPIRDGVVPRAANRAATGAERRVIAKRVAEALEAGAVGVSFGPYHANSLADEEELAVSAREAARRGRPFVAHRRCEGPDVIAATREFLRVCECAGAAAHISHLKVAGKRHWPTFEAMLGDIEAAERRHDVSYDIYPYDGSLTYLSALVPTWAKADGRLKERLSAAPERARIAAAMAGWFEDRQGPEDILVFGAREVGQPAPSLAKLAEERGGSPAEVALGIISADPEGLGGWAAYRRMMDPEQVALLRRGAKVIVASDAVPEAGAVPEETHPRAYGTFARVLGEAGGLEGIAAALPAMTSRPAERFGLQGLGRLEEGAVADLALLDPQRIRDRADYDRPAEYPEGVEMVWLGGELRLDGSGLREGKGEVWRAG